MRTTMPSETITAVVGSVVGAVLILVDAFAGLKVDGAAAGAITTLVSWMAFAVTILVRLRRKRAAA